MLPEHRPVHHEDQRLQERLRDRRQREAADLPGEAGLRVDAHTIEVVEPLAHEQARRVARAVAAVAEARDRAARWSPPRRVRRSASRPTPSSRTSMTIVARESAPPPGAGRRRSPRACAAGAAGRPCAASTFCPGWSIAHAAMPLMSCRRHSIGLALHVEQALDLGHHLLVRLLVALRDPVVEPLLLHPHAHVLDVAVEELGVLLLLHQAARDVELVLRGLRAAA